GNRTEERRHTGEILSYEKCPDFQLRVHSRFELPDQLEDDSVVERERCVALLRSKSPHDGNARELIERRPGLVESLALQCPSGGRDAQPSTEDAQQRSRRVVIETLHDAVCPRPRLERQRISL